MAYENIIVGTRGRVGMITLNRPKALNALNDALMNELGEALAKFDADEGIGAIVIAGGDKAFAAGADIGAMKDRGYRDVYMGEFVTRNWERMKSVRKPVIAAVAGYALGGGCELAMMCDIVIAAERAGLVSRVVPADKLIEEAFAAAAQIAEFSLPSVMMAKESVNRAFESPLAEGMLFERRLFHALFATEDQKEGMAAFVEKRKPKFKHK